MKRHLYPENSCSGSCPIKLTRILELVCYQKSALESELLTEIVETGEWSAGENRKKEEFENDDGGLDHFHV